MDPMKADEMGKQSRTSVHGKKNQMGQDAAAKSGALKKARTGLQRKLKKPSQEIESQTPISSSTPVVKERPRLTVPTRVSFPTSRIPCPISRLPNPGHSSGSHMRLKGGQGEKSEKVPKHQNPPLGAPDLHMKQAIPIKPGNSGLPPPVRGKRLLPPVHGKETLTSIHLPLKTEETDSTRMQRSFKTSHNVPALLSSVWKKQCGVEILSLTSLSPSSDMKVLFPDDFDLSTSEFFSDKVVTPEIPTCKKDISNLALKFPDVNDQMEMIPSNLSKPGIIPVEFPCLSTLPKCPILSSSTNLDFSPRVGQKKGSSNKKLEMFDSVPSTFSTKESPESSPGQDSVYFTCNDIPDTQSPSYPLPSSSGMKEHVIPPFQDVSKEQELFSSSTQICRNIESTNAPALSSEEKVLERMEEEFDSGNGGKIDENTPKNNLCSLS